MGHNPKLAWVEEKMWGEEKRPTKPGPKKGSGGTRKVCPECGEQCNHVVQTCNQSGVRFREVQLKNVMEDLQHRKISFTDEMKMSQSVSLATQRSVQSSAHRFVK